MHFSEEHQINILEGQMPFRELLRPAVPGDGIVVLTESEVEASVLFYGEKSVEKEVVRFIPASGAASRMFADLQKVLAGESSLSAAALFESWPLLPFASWLEPFAPQTPAELARVICVDLGMDKKPKGLIPFHGPGAHTAFEEQLHEAKMLGAGRRIVNHFTVSRSHESDIRDCIRQVLSQSRDFDNVECVFSYQNPDSDTVCVYADGQTVKDEQNRNLKRPGGHGALLENLNALNADVIFIKNIDNVQPRRLHAKVVEWKKALAGLGLSIKSATDRVLRAIIKGQKPTHADIVYLTSYFSSLPSDDAAIFEYLNKPLRVCGMVPNQGQPGGGPFWTRNGNGSTNLQIVESAEIDFLHPDQAAIAARATHFNPVDLVCFTRDFNGEKFDLYSFANPDAVFISHKTHNGKPIKALEWPGLWNGGMSEWLTVFVEVPSFTFSPVKTVADLLRPEHQ